MSTEQSRYLRPSLSAAKLLLVRQKTCHSTCPTVKRLIVNLEQRQSSPHASAEASVPSGTTSGNYTSTYPISIIPKFTQSANARPSTTTARPFPVTSLSSPSIPIQSSQIPPSQYRNVHTVAAPPNTVSSGTFSRSFSHLDDPQSMATVLQPASQQQFNSVDRVCSSPVYSQLTSQQTGIRHTQQVKAHKVHRTEYSPPSRWPSEHLSQSRSSNSPHIRDRTPIRNNRPEMNRHRSNSRPEVILAYAEEQQRQSQQMQQAQQMSPNTMYVSSIDSTMSNFAPSPYPYQISPPSYMTQPTYYDGTPTVQSSRMGTYGNLVMPHGSPNSTAYPPQHSDMAMTQSQTDPLGSGEMVYGQSKMVSLPSVAPVPSNFPPIPQPLESTPTEVEVSGSRQKPQCWDHGCNGRQFSTFSNLLRHQREKSGTATKARCPHCGTEFTRTTARNGHLYGGKCKGLSDVSKTSDGHGEEDDGA